MALNVGGSASADYKDVTPGYVSPFGGGTDWDQTPEIDRTGLFESLFDKARSKEKYRTQAEDSAKEEERRAATFSGTGSTPGSTQRVTENASVYTPPQMAPYTVQGVQGRPGVLSQVAGIAAPVVGMMGGPTARFISKGLSGLSRSGW
jgi:hypothetical protein